MPAEYAAKCEVSAAPGVVQPMETTGNTRKAASIMIVETSRGGSEVGYRLTRACFK